ncbi:MAG: adenosylcobinamide-GDP ribazoletransferase [Synechococcus sp.]|nr:adenosylcobinamide-GDP ribazoletransferase [Synechococcus sp.]
MPNSNFKKFIIQLRTNVLQLWRSLLGSILFYTILPLPKSCHPYFVRLARWSPWLGLVLGGILVGLFLGLSALQVTPFLKSSLVVTTWLSLTGGLHLDGAMDSADGLAVTDPQRRLTVMADSVSGAFGVMVALVILLLKIAAGESLSPTTWWILFFVPAWGRWSQVMAIAFYPYLKPTGKGAFHKQQFRFYADLSVGIAPIFFGIWLCYFVLPVEQRFSFLLSNLSSLVVAIAVSHWFGSRFRGHTGDTYGAVVEWTEVFSLIGAVLIANRL